MGQPWARLLLWAMGLLFSMYKISSSSPLMIANESHLVPDLFPADTTCGKAPILKLSQPLSSGGGFTPWLLAAGTPTFLALLLGSS